MADTTASDGGPVVDTVDADGTAVGAQTEDGAVEGATTGAVTDAGDARSDGPEGAAAGDDTATVVDTSPPAASPGATSTVAGASPSGTAPSGAPSGAAEAPATSTSGGAAAARDLAAARRQAEGTVRAWASTWANQDVDVYLNFYSSRFSPPAGLSRSAWEAQRRERLTAPRSIEVEVSSLSIEATSLDRAQARFEQSYTSDRYSDVVTKVLTLVWEEGQWRILREEVAES